MDLGIRDRVALVAASSQGLGRAVAEELAAAGCRLMMCSRRAAAIEEAAGAVASAHGVDAHGMAADLTNPGDVTKLVDATMKQFGQVDILVTNTGGPPAGPFEQHSPETWRQAVAQNFESVLNLTRPVLPGMKERNWGRIVNVTSITVKQPVDGLILSNAVRAAVTGFARTLATEVAPFGVTVNNVLPGFTRTERLEQLAATRVANEGIERSEAFATWESQIPMARIGEPREFAAMVAFLASERASYITGQSVPVDGGWIRSLI